jgi:signal transduction histidine kinase
VANGATPDRIIRQRAFRNLAKARVRRLPHRAALYGIATVIAANFVPPALGLLCLGLIVAAESTESFAARAFLARPASGRATPGRKTGFIAANIATALAMAAGLALVWDSAGTSHQIIAFCFMATVVLNVAVANPQVAGLLIPRQILYTGTGIVMTVRDVALAGQSWTAEAAMHIVPVCTFAAFALLMSCRSAAAYRERLEREMQLATARDDAERADAAKSAFVATVSHELRTPLNGVLGMAQTLLGSGLAPAQRHQVEIILESGRTLNALLTDILDYAKLEAGKLAIEPAEADPRRTVDEVARLYGPVAANKGLDLNVTVAPELPARLVFDAVRVRQCLSNLVSNALKFTETGSVSLCLTAAPAGAGPNGAGQHLVTIAVTDTGIGIAAGGQQHLFQPFSQADSSIARRYGGTGLGLSITRQLAESMGGTVTLKSAPGEGSEFRLSFLAEDGPAAPEGACRTGAEGTLAARRVLVVDDTESNRLVMRLFLQPLGVEVIEAADGAAALVVLTSGGFDAALLDLNLPGIGGAEIAARIRRGEGGRRDLPLLAVTADSADSATDLGAAGFDGVVSKPVDPRLLQSKLIAAVLHGRKPALRDSALP